jgi:hypothetical protein
MVCQIFRLSCFTDCRLRQGANGYYPSELGTYLVLPTAAANIKLFLANVVDEI